MKWFGCKYDAPVWEDMEQADVPVGQNCFLCGEPFYEDDDGLLIPDHKQATWFPHHVVCFLDSILGPSYQLPVRVEEE